MPHFDQVGLSPSPKMSIKLNFKSIFSVAGEEKALESSEMKEPEKSSEIELEGEIVGGAEGGGGEDEYDDYYDEDDIAERVTTETPKPNDNPDGEEIEENAFGRKVRRKKKKMETRLLKEILNDVKVSSKRFS